MACRLYQVVLPVSDLRQAESFYGALLESSGRRVSPLRMHFDCAEMLLTCAEVPSVTPNSNPVIFVVDDLEAFFERARSLGALEDEQLRTRPWGGSTFRVKDPFGNIVGFADQRMVERQADERISGGPENYLSVGLALSVQQDSDGAKKHVVSISRFFSEEVWFAFSQPPDPAPLAAGDRARLLFWVDGVPMMATCDVISIEGRNLALSVPAEASQLQRRSSPRVPARVPITFKVLRAAQADLVSDTLHQGTTQDVSVGGMRIETNVPLQVDDEFEGTMRLQADVEITAGGKVVALGEVERGGARLVSAGVQFLELRLDDQIKILQFLIEQEEAQAGASPAAAPEPAAQAPPAASEPPDGESPPAAAEPENEATRPGTEPAESEPAKPPVTVPSPQEPASAEETIPGDAETHRED